MRLFLAVVAVVVAVSSSLSAATVRIVAPAAGEPVLVDSTITIRWEGADGASVALWYSTDGRTTWTLLASNLRTDEYRWTVPDLPFDSIAFRIEALFGAPIVPLRRYPDAHEGEIRTASFSRDGRFMLSAGKDGYVKVRDLATDEVDSAAFPNGGEVYAARFAATTDSVFLNQADGVYLWDRIRDVVEPMPALVPATGLFRTLDVFPDRHLLAAAGDGGVLYVWDYRTQTEAGRTATGAVLVYSAAFSHDGSKVIFAGDDGVVYVWDRASGQPPRAYRQHGSGTLNLVVWSCAFAPGDTTMVSGGVDGTVRVWKASADTATAVFRHNLHVRSASVAPDGRRVLSGSLDNTVRQWDPVFGAQIGDSLDHGGQVIAAAYSPTGDTILSAGRDGAIILWSSGLSSEGRDTAGYVLGRECVLEIPHLTGDVGRGMYVPLVWRNRSDIEEFMTAEGTATVELPNTLLETVNGGNTLERRRGVTRDTVLLPVLPGLPGDTIAVIAVRTLLGVPVRQDIRILSVHWEPGVRLVPRTVDGSVTVRDTCGLLTLRAVQFRERGAVLSVTPNPVVETAYVTVTLAADEQPRLAVYNARGDEVLVVDGIPARAGVHRVEVPVQRLPAGEYFVRLETGTQQYSARCTVVR